MNRRDIKNKNKIGDEIGDNELQPLQGFSSNSNGLNNKFGKYMQNFATNKQIKLYT